MFLVEMFQRKTTMPTAAEALAGRADPVETASTHFVNGRPLKGPFPQGSEIACFAMGRFSAAERLFWPLHGVHVTAAGYAGGFTPNPTYQELMTSLTGHAQTVMVVFDPDVITYRALLRIFFEGHDPTQAMRQGNDIGTFFRSAIFTTSPLQLEQAGAARQTYQEALTAAGHGGRIVTAIAPLTEFHYAETNHQQHAARNPGARTGLKGTGVGLPDLA
ncbi:MAG: peptide-methionine (S)-S-oxide reductase MsrA [Hoeflea sp.]|uniref:peptide-methionine (S)-S-oxide reductase MsrA n=1 Tax=Hoeflea sp. TaxID=1940281 RepID=UPI001D9C2FF0|nr:peptide-methionine (S)-S-oxide reductase MsrA [Hoeflea sp.]MBU4531596.1 peptide-methionine (S)-S-oxide reductase MsrA [Alphaproteobacteria bacterium]MBU4544453.1 peptide-methionine (S)-S-oxide reductase MsrA [Alphaproteobacteria bacterium]MBU4550310.1 peptide-methionine (S)-S-oxide reductase MsrA [Alphaproteobacteria bacterium]MBV1724872.1 peptide-methionine (S)-S-oxide reductase MsrA [Hoeflea sp.]MBV1760892.1 peptide-methionine (S)-S-oxide reductase MsrA [Hoeflea sp.]